MTQRGVELKQSKGGGKQIPLEPLPPERAEPIAYMADALRNKKTIEGLVALDINVGVNEIIEAAKMSVKSGQAVKLK
jgi:predicted dehydrogenase